MSIMRLPCLVCTMLVPTLAMGADDPAWTPVPGHVAPAANEHPRLFVRKADVPNLRKRAEKPEGKAILAQLRLLLGGGEEMPTNIPQATAAYQNVDKNLPLGAYTLWHGAGFGTLYQVTGDRKYAELGKQCIEMAMQGVRDRDDRYAYVNPGGFLRAGPSVGAIAMAYDLCFDGWDEGFRTKVAKSLQDYDGGKTSRDGGGQQTMERLALKPQMHPRSNHWGGQVGGAGLAMLAIRGDTGTDQAKVDRYLDGVHANFMKLFEGQGDRAYFHEGPGPGQINTDTALVPFVFAARQAWGRDYTTRADVRWLALQWAMLLVQIQGGKPYYPAATEGGSYGGPYFERHGLSRGGQFVQGFGILPPAEQQALLWSYNTYVAPTEKATYGDRIAPGNALTCDVITYPHRAALALATWPMGIPPANPATVLPKATYDSRMGFFMFRNRWQDSDDILVSFVTNARGDAPNDLNVWAFGDRQFFGWVDRGLPVYWGAALDGSAVLGLGTRTHIAVDFTKTSGADAVIVRLSAGGDWPKRAGKGDAISGKPAASGGKVQLTALDLAGTKAEVLTLAADSKHPQAAVANGAITVGAQTFTFTDGKIAIAKCGALRTTN
jgi:hypothetical protein